MKKNEIVKIWKEFFNEFIDVKVAKKILRKAKVYALPTAIST